MGLLLSSKMLNNQIQFWKPWRAWSKNCAKAAHQMCWDSHETVQCCAIVKRLQPGAYRATQGLHVRQKWCCKYLRCLCSYLFWLIDDAELLQSRIIVEDCYILFVRFAYHWPFLLRSWFWQMMQNGVQTYRWLRTSFTFWHEFWPSFRAVIRIRLVQSFCCFECSQEAKLQLEQCTEKLGMSSRKGKSVWFVRVLSILLALMVERCWELKMLKDWSTHSGGWSAAGISQVTGLVNSSTVHPLEGAFHTLT